MDEQKMILEILKGAYDDCDLETADLEDLAYDLYWSVYDDEEPLTEILNIVYQYEEFWRSYDIKIDVGRQCLIYSAIVNRLERNEKNAKRLYESFSSYRDLTGFYSLMDDFDEWLTKEELDNVLEIAKQTFVKPIWEHYVKK